MSPRAFTVTQSEQTVPPRQGVESLDPGELGDGTVTVRVAWSGLNYKDAMVTQPGNKVARISPLVPGVDLAGTVAESDDESIGVGSSVLVHGYDLGVAHHGGFSELARVPSDWVVPLPPNLDARKAMIIGTAGFTAFLSLQRLEALGVRPTHGPILVTGASGGVGSMAVALLAHEGFEVVASSGKHDEHPYLRSLGATAVVDRQEILVPEGRPLGPERWAAAVDCVGGSTLASVMRSLRYGGAVAATGLTGGSEVTTTVYPFIIRQVSVLGVDSVQTPIQVRRSIWEEIARRFPLARLDDIVSAEIGLGDLEQALADLLASRVRGRILVNPR